MLTIFFNTQRELGNSPSYIYRFFFTVLPYCQYLFFKVFIPNSQTDSTTENNRTLFQYCLKELGLFLSTAFYTSIAKNSLETWDGVINSVSRTLGTELCLPPCWMLKVSSCNVTISQYRSSKEIAKVK